MKYIPTILISGIILGFILGFKSPVKKYSCSMSFYIIENKIYEVAEINEITITPTWIRISGKNLNTTLKVLSVTKYPGYSVYIVKGGVVEIHHKKVFVNLGSIDNVYLYR